MNKIIKVRILDFIYEILEKFSLRKKFDKQVNKIKIWIFDNSLNFEKIECKKWIIFYSFRIVFIIEHIWEKKIMNL